MKFDYNSIWFDILSFLIRFVKISIKMIIIIDKKNQILTSSWSEKNSKRLR